MILPADEKRARRRRIVIAVVISCLFVIGLVSLAIYAAPPAGAPRPIPHPAPPWVVRMVLSGCVAVIAAIVGAGVYSARSLSTCRRQYDAAMSLLMRGALVEARTRFEALSKRRWPGGQFATIAKYHLAVVMLRLGDIDGALARFMKLQRPIVGLNYESQAFACIQLGVCLVLSGDLQTGDAWLVEAEARAAKTVSRLSVDQQLVFARALYDCRRGALEEAAHKLQSRWRELEASLTGEAIRPLRLLHAFAVAASSGPRESAQVEQILQPLRGGPPGELAWLGARWPEMQAFLAAYSL